MLAKEKARREPGGGRTTAGKLLPVSQYTTPDRKIKPTRALSSMLDQALNLAEQHEALAEFHRRRAAKHRAILKSLQTLIPYRKLNTEGEITNG